MCSRDEASKCRGILLVVIRREFQNLTRADWPRSVDDLQFS